MAWSTEETRRQARDMRMGDALTREAYEAMDAAERRGMLKDARARRFSGLERYPSTMEAVEGGLIAALEDNGLLEAWDRMTYAQQGAMLVAFKCGYDAGRSDR